MLEHFGAVCLAILSIHENDKFMRYTSQRSQGGHYMLQPWTKFSRKGHDLQPKIVFALFALKVLKLKFCKFRNFRTKLSLVEPHSVT